MSNMLDIHKEAMENTPTLFHEFLLDYKNNNKCIYAFVEGKTDPSYYADKIKNELPEIWEVDYWIAGNKKKVLEIYYCFDWLRFNPQQIIFFIDRDFSEYLNEDTPQEQNIYITDGYSIENSLVNKDICKRILQDIKGMQDLRGKEMANVLALFESQLMIFYQFMLIISAHMIAWRQKGCIVCSDNLKMGDLFEFEKGYLKLNSKYRRKEKIPAYLCKKFSLKRRGIFPYLETATDILKKESDPKRFVRGKYELWFLIYFCKSIYTNYSVFSSKTSKKPKEICSLSLHNALSIIAPRVRTPNSLKKFLSKTVVAYSHYNN